MAFPKGAQVEALALAGPAVVCAGSVPGAEAGKTAGFLWIVNASDGKKKAEAVLDSAPVCDGLAVTPGRIFVTLRNGELACLGQPPP